MKKRITAFAIALLLICTSCTSAEPSTDGTATESAPTVPTEPTPPEWAGDSAAFLAENFPIIDGSTSLIPLEAAVRADIFGISMDEATPQVEHSSTWGSFYNLLDGKCDVIFTCPLSEEQRQMAAERGIELECVPVAKEGFIFVVNGENSVEELTQAEIKGIYSGQITNWSEVGGPDSPIIAYQRNNESGSQNYMIEFMGDTPLTDAPSELRPTTMAGILDVLSANDNALNSIGYSVYAYAADMYGDGDDIKFIAVDGVAPDKQTMASGEYPLMGINYAVFRADEPGDSSVRALVEYMTSYDGQLAAAGAGYITLTDIGYDYTEMTLERYSGTGVAEGSSAGESRTDYVAERKNETYGNYNYVLNRDESVDFLTDKELEAEINTAIADAIKEIGGWRTVTVTAKNGYLSVEISRAVKHVEYREYNYENTICAVWDLYTGKRLEIEEMFFGGVDIDEVLNAYLTRVSQLPYEVDHTMMWFYDMKRDFAALPLKGWDICAEAIYINEDNPFFSLGVRIPLDDLPAGSVVWEVPRTMDGMFDDSVIVSESAVEPDRTYYDEAGDTYAEFLKAEYFPTAHKINAGVKQYLEEHFTFEALDEHYPSAFLSSNKVCENWSCSFTDGYVIFNRGMIELTGVIGDASSKPYPYDKSLVFDLATGEPVDWWTMLKDGWIEAAVPGYGAEWDSVTADLDKWHLLDTYASDEDVTELSLICHDSGDRVRFSLPNEYLK